MGFGVEPIQTTLGNVVEKRKEPIEIFLRDWIVLVVVAAATSHGQSHPDGCCSGNAIDDILRAIFLVDHSPFDGDRVVAVKTSGKFLLSGGLRQKIAS